jgi:hypothetical protein
MALMQIIYVYFRNGEIFTQNIEGKWGFCMDFFFKN